MDRGGFFSRAAKRTIAESAVLKTGKIWCDGCVDKAEFGKRLRIWFRRHGRDLPWRRTRDPYEVLVSEMMLQQTTVAAVVPYFGRWLERFPSVRELATADEAEVLALWQGLGYYRRARSLHAAARKVAGELRGEFPRDYDGLRELPGVGDYTAQAVRAFAFDKPVPVLDANVIRVMARLSDIRTPVDTAKGLGKVRGRLEELLPAKGGHEFISAMMELGALVCRAGRPDCLLCPVKMFCSAKRPETLPIKAPKPPVKACIEHAAWIGDGRTVLLQQSQSRRWTGLWRLPPMGTVPRHPPVVELAYSIVRERVTLKVHRASRGALEASTEPRCAFPLADLERIAIPSPHRRVIAKMLKQEHIQGS